MTSTTVPPPRVLFVNHASRLAGAELVLLDVVRGVRGASAFLFEDGPLRRALYQLGVATVVGGQPGAFSAIKRDRSLLRALPHAGALARLWVKLRATVRRAEIVYANSQKAFVLAALACATTRRKLIWHLHDILVPGHFGRGQIALTIRLANAVAAAVIVPSQAAADAFTRAGGRPGLLRLVPNGLDAEPVRPDLSHRQAARARFDLEQPFIFGVFSRLSPWKGQDVALRALAELPEAGCVIVGGALFGEDDYARSLVALARDLAVSDRVLFAGHRDDVPALMRSVDAVVHPSTEPEPFGRTLVEAMLARRPVVAAEAGAVPEILDGGRVGLLFPPGDAAALAACLRRVATGDADPMLDPAEARAREHYGAARMRDAIRDIVAEVAGAPQ